MTFRAVSQIATVLSYVVIVRGMAEHDFGVLNLLYAFIPVVSTMASLGLEQVLRRYQPEYLRAGNPAASAWLVRFVASARFVTNLLVIGIVLALWNLVAPIFHIESYRLEFAMFSALILMFFQSRILQLSLASHMMHRYSVGSMALLPVAKLVAYLILTATHSFSLQAAIIADTIATAVAYAFLSHAHRKRCASPANELPFKPDAAERRRLWHYGLLNNFNDAGTWLLGTRSDNFFIAAFLNPIAVGAYSFYNRLNEMVANVSPGRLFDNVIQPMFFATPKESAERRIPRYFTLLLNMNLPLQLAALTYSVVYHKQVVSVLFAGKFIENSWLLPVVMGFALLNVIAVPVTLVAQYAEKAWIILLGKVTVVYQLAATLVLIPLIGLYGAAIATGSAQLLKNLFVWWHVRHTARWLNFSSVLTMSVLIWGVAGAACWSALTFLPVPALIQLLVGAIICVIAGLLYVRSPAIAHDDRQMLSGVLHGREARLLRYLGVLRN